MVCVEILYGLWTLRFFTTKELWRSCFMLHKRQSFWTV